MPLLLKRGEPEKYESEQTSYDVLSGGWRVGFIRQFTRGQHKGRWEWALLMLEFPRDIMASRGISTSRDDAMDALRLDFEFWLKWARLREGD